MARDKSVRHEWGSDSKGAVLQWNSTTCTMKSFIKIGKIWILILKYLLIIKIFFDPHCILPPNENEVSTTVPLPHEEQRWSSDPVGFRHTTRHLSQSRSHLRSFFGGEPEHLVSWQAREWVALVERAVVAEGEGCDEFLLGEKVPVEDCCQGEVVLDGLALGALDFGDAESVCVLQRVSAERVFDGKFLGQALEGC